MTNIQKPDLDNIEMHMPEGDLALPETETHSRITNAPILILLLLLLLLILGGMYWWYVAKLKVEPFEPTLTRPTAEQNNEPESTTAEAQTSSLGVMSTSDELSTIEADLESTNLDSLEAEMNAIEAELNRPE